MADPTVVPAEILDGAPPVGTIGTITIDSVAFPVLSEKLTPTWKSVEDYTAIGYPNRKRWVKDRYKLDLTLQLSRLSGHTYGGAYPISGSTFTYVVSGETAAVNFVVTEVPIERDNGQAIETAKITAEQTIGTVTTV